MNLDLLVAPPANPAVNAAQVQSSLCNDFSAFQEKLKEWRRIDDRIANVLNTTVPTESFAASVDSTKQCQSLYGQMSQSYEKRQNAISTCITHAKTVIATTQNQRLASADGDPETTKILRKHQTQLRLLQNELNIEQVIQDQSLKQFNEKCRRFYRPPAGDSFVRQVFPATTIQFESV